MESMAMRYLGIKLTISPKNRELQEKLFTVIARTIFFSLLLSLTVYGLNYHISKSLMHFAAFLSVINILVVISTKIAHGLLQDKKIIYICSSMLIIAAITMISTQIFDNPISRNHDKNFAYPLIFFALILYSLKIKPNDYNLIFYAAAIGCINMGSAGIYDFYLANSTTYRTAGTQNMPIIYASGMALLTSWMSVEFFSRLSKRQWKLMSLCLVAFFIGYTAILLTASRGPILAITLVSIALFIRYLISLPSNRKGLSILLFFSCFLIAFSTSLFNTEIGNNIISRFESGVTNVGKFIESDQTMTSAGIRLNMWKGALITIGNYPLLGIGTGTHNEHFSQLSGQMDISNFDHIHNDSLQILMSLGLIFGGITLLVIWYPTLLFIQALTSNKKAIVGLSVCITYILCGLTDAPSFRAASLTMFLLIIVLQIGIIRSDRLEDKNV
jgi:O-antigen ligase